MAAMRVAEAAEIARIQQERAAREVMPRRVTSYVV
jgi:hypothetical protein